MEFEYDKLTDILNGVKSWIENCDSKVSTILSGMGVLAGVLLATDYVSKFKAILQFMWEKKTAWSVIYLIISFTSLGLLIYGVFLLLGVLFARVNQTEFEV